MRVGAWRVLPEVGPAMLEPSGDAHPRPCAHMCRCQVGCHQRRAWQAPERRPVRAHCHAHGACGVPAREVPTHHVRPPPSSLGVGTVCAVAVGYMTLTAVRGMSPPAQRWRLERRYTVVSYLVPGPLAHHLAAHSDPSAAQQVRVHAHHGVGSLRRTAAPSPAAVWAGCRCLLKLRSGACVRRRQQATTTATATARPWLPSAGEREPRQKASQLPVLLARVPVAAAQGMWLCLATRTTQSLRLTTTMTRRLLRTWFALPSAQGRDHRDEHHQHDRPGSRPQLLRSCLVNLTC